MNSPQGDIEVQYNTDRETGVIDVHISPAPGVEGVAFSRVVSDGKRCEYIFTQFPAPGMLEEAFRAQADSLQDELRALKAHMEA